MAKPDEVAVYGSAEHAARLFEGVAKVVEREPETIFADADLRTSAAALRDLLTRRLDPADPATPRSLPGHPSPRG
jgi:hypothetical protein